MDSVEIVEWLKIIGMIVFVIINNLYCIPAYLVWTWVFLFPLYHYNERVYWKVEGILFQWLLYMVSAWSWMSNYIVYEVGEDISSCYDHRCLVILNHQSTADVPLLMAAIQSKNSVCSHVMWVMDRLFKFTNFGLVSLTHRDFFISQGKDVRDTQLVKLQKHIIHKYLPQGLKWIVLFPEGGFLRKRLATSQSYAKKNNFPVLQHVTLPRVGAMHIIMETLRPEKFDLSLKEANLDGEKPEPLKWIIDITVGYPDGIPIGLDTICSGSRPPCRIYLHYRRYAIEDLPSDDPDVVRDWLYARWTEKEEMLEEYYSTKVFPAGPKSQSNPTTNPNHSELLKAPKMAELDNLFIIFLHIFWIASTWFHCYVLRHFWSIVTFGS